MANASVNVWQLPTFVRVKNATTGVVPREETGWAAVEYLNRPERNQFTSRCTISAWSSDPAATCRAIHRTSAGIEPEDAGAGFPINGLLTSSGVPAEAPS